MKFGKRKSALLGAVLLATTFGIGSAATAADVAEVDAQSKVNPGVTAEAAVAPNRCALDRQVSSSETHLELTNNVPYTLANVAGWQLLRCTTTSFTVPRGESAGVHLRYSGEFDASGPAGNTGWVQARVMVAAVGAGTVDTVLPDNDGRGDSFALDSSKGLFSDWSAHVLHQSTRVFCPSTSVNAVCTYRVWAQGALTAGANYFWYDDTTLGVDVYNSRANGAPVRVNVAP